MARRATMRASDHDRDLAAERLRQAAAEGRLLAEELEHRLAQALRARTYGELDPLVADLPHDRRSVQPRRAMPVATVLAPVVAAMVLLAVLGLVLMVMSGLVMTWGVWLFLGWWFFSRGRRAGRCCRSRNHVHFAHRRTLL